MIDYGEPLITQRLVLENLLESGKILEKIEEVIVGKNLISTKATYALEKYVNGLSDVRDEANWRLLEYKKLGESIYFDVIEYLDLVMDKNGHAIIENINGEIKLESLISEGVVNAFLTIPQVFEDYSHHECLVDTIDSFSREKLLSFVPPSGNSSLLFYSVTNVSARLPFELLPSISNSGGQTHITIQIEPKSVRGEYYSVEDMFVKLILPHGMEQKKSDNTVGNLSFKEGNLIWKIGNLQKDKVAKCNLSFTPNTSNKQINLCLKFQVIGFSITGTKIEKVEIKNTNKSITKKARNVVKSGYFEYRLN